MTIIVIRNDYIFQFYRPLYNTDRCAYQFVIIGISNSLFPKEIIFKIIFQVFLIGFVGSLMLIDLSWWPFLLCQIPREGSQTRIFMHPFIFVGFFYLWDWISGIFASIYFWNGVNCGMVCLQKKCGSSGDDTSMAQYIDYSLKT